MGNVQKNIQLMLEFFKAPLYIFLLYINDFPDDVICNIVIYTDDTTLYYKCDQAPDLWKQLELAAELETDLWDTVDYETSGVLISMLKKLNWFRLTILTLVLLMWRWMGLFLRKNHLLRCRGCLSLLNWIGALTLSLLLNLPPRKLERCFVL